KIIMDLLKYFNDNEHFQQYQNIYKTTKDYEVEENYIMIAQLDSLIKANYTFQNKNSSVSVNTIADQYNLIDKKKQLVANLRALKMEHSEYISPIKSVNVNYNMEPEKIIDISNKIKYPLLLVFLFSLIFSVLYIFKSLKRYSNEE